jgi:hypothetical protein
MSGEDYTRWRPANDEAFEYYFTYIRLVPPGNLIQLAHEQVDQLRELFRYVPDAVAVQLHAPYTWTIKQVVGHLIDAERILPIDFIVLPAEIFSHYQVWIRSLMSLVATTNRLRCQH